MRDMDNFKKIHGEPIAKHFSDLIYPDNEKLKKELIEHINSLNGNNHENMFTSKNTRN